MAASVLVFPVVECREEDLLSATSNMQPSIITHYCNV